MHKFAAFLLMTAGCASVNRAGVPTVATAAEPAPPIDLLLAQRFIAELDAMCAADGGKLWGRSLAGPLIFVDPVTRYAVSNRADTRGVLKAKGTLFVGPLSDDVLLANTAVEWDGSRWTMVIWASLVDAPNAQRRKLLAHEAFHRVQPELGLRVPDDLNTHLDTKDGRVLMQLEWGALEVALNAHD
ncbi:MAG: hypothetical protein K1X64_21600, partial [Myxococcaceae bacterium]|nr:hypothetical protein [Myxococcaceae bacterium]